MSKMSHDEIFSTFEEITNNYSREDQYFDILYDSTSSTRIMKTPSSEDYTISNEISGIVARTYTDTWKEVAVENGADLKIIEKKLPKVSKKGDMIKEYEGWKFNQEVKPKIDFTTVSLDEKIKKIRDIFEHLMNYDERIFNVKIGYSEILTERIFFNNEGCQLRQVLPRSRIIFMPIAREGSVQDYDYSVKSGQIGFEIFDLLPEKTLDKIAENSLELLKAQLPPSGRTTVILDPGMAGLIAHESFGHGLEADQVLRDRSYLKKYLNKPVASEACYIYDNPSIKGQTNSYFFDDEGIKAGTNKLVENGILKNFLYDRRTADVLNTKPQGNGRRESYAHPLNVRMTSTYFGSGDYELDEMISEIKNGVLMIHGYFGMEDPLGGGLQGTSKKSYLIENGEKTKILKATAISGAVLELLKNIDAVSKDPLKLSSGTCGKGSEDYVPVTDGGSYIRAKNALISPG